MVSQTINRSGSGKGRMGGWINPWVGIARRVVGEGIETGLGVVFAGHSIAIDRAAGGHQWVGLAVVARHKHAKVNIVDRATDIDKAHGAGRIWADGAGLKASWHCRLNTCFASGGDIYGVNACRIRCASKHAATGHGSDTDIPDTWLVGITDTIGVVIAKNPASNCARIGCVGSTRCYRLHLQHCYTQHTRNLCCNHR